MAREGEAKCQTHDACTAAWRGLLLLLFFPFNGQEIIIALKSQDPLCFLRDLFPVPCVTGRGTSANWDREGGSSRVAAPHCAVALSWGGEGAWGRCWDHVAVTPSPCITPHSPCPGAAAPGRQSRERFTCRGMGEAAFPCWLCLCLLARSPASLFLTGPSQLGGCSSDFCN